MSLVSQQGWQTRHSLAHITWRGDHSAFGTNSPGGYGIHLEGRRLVQMPPPLPITGAILKIYF